ncbi:MAG TPA: hypothetical protein VFI39_05780 [Gemmatimonadales bacterium]|nr:hypothetical protein [Gemmatimonadales bacterium]
MSILRRAGLGALGGGAIALVGIAIGMIRAGLLSTRGTSIDFSGSRAELLGYCGALALAGAWIASADDRAGSRARRVAVWASGGIALMAGIAGMDKIARVQPWSIGDLVFVVAFGFMLGLAGLVGTGAR